MKNLAVWTVLICTAAFGVAVAQPIQDLAFQAVPADVITA